jgi:putative transposase
MRTLPAQAIEAEVAELLDKHAELKTEAGPQRIVRHGHLPERETVTGIGAVAVRRLRIQHLNNVAITKTPPSRS